MKDKNTLVYTEQWRLINKKELYDIKADPGQKDNIADSNPDVIAHLSAKYDDYWNELGMDDFPYPRPIIGTEFQKETRLNTINWIRLNNAVHSWNQRHVLAGDTASGFWPVEIEKDGLYQFEVRRWPKELNIPISEGLPESQISDITSLGEPVQVGEGKALPAVKVRIKVGNQLKEKEINPSDQLAGFELSLQKGETKIEAWLLDFDWNKQNAYYIYVKPVNEV